MPQIVLNLALKHEGWRLEEIRKKRSLKGQQILTFHFGLKNRKKSCFLMALDLLSKMPLFKSFCRFLITLEWRCTLSHFRWQPFFMDSLCQCVL